MTNVFLFTLDAFRKDIIGPNTTPFLSDLIDSSVYFNEAVATGSGTSSSFPGILAGVHPLEYGYRELRDEHTTIAEQIDDKVYSVGVSSSAPTSRLYGFNRGFTQFEDDEGSGLFGSIKKQTRHSFLLQNSDYLFKLGEKALSFVSGIRSTDNNTIYTQADEVTDTVLEKFSLLKDENSFLWAHYMDTHEPYHPPRKFYPDRTNPQLSKEDVNEVLEEYKWDRPPLNSDGDEGRQLTPEEWDTLQFYYEAEAAFIDANLERLYNTIDETFRDYTIIICADHGEEFGDHGHFGHLPKLYRELINVPLIIHTSDGESGTVDRAVSTAGIPATVASLFDVQPADDWAGPSLLERSDSVESEYVLSELSHSPDEGLGGEVKPEKAKVSVRNGNWKYIYDHRRGDEELYNLAVDPGETSNVRDDNESIARELKRVCEERLDEISESTSTIDQNEIISERLEDLGYIKK